VHGTILQLKFMKYIYDSAFQSSLLTCIKQYAYKSGDDF
jgi:hypothetical protein